MSYSDYASAYRRSIKDPEGFWEQEAKRVHWFKPFDQVLDRSTAPHLKWFKGGETNLCYNALDRHVEAGKGDQPAIIWESPETEKSSIWSFSETLARVNKLAHFLRKIGVKKGDRVGIYMPMIPEALVSALACARIGAIHVIGFSGYAAVPLAERIKDSQPKLIITASHSKRGGRIIPIKEVVDRALEIASFVKPKVLVFDRGLAECPMVDGRDLDWECALKDVSSELFACEPVAATDPAFILYTAAGDGRVDGMVHDTGGYLVAVAASMKQIYDCGPGDVYWSTSDIGWIVGHSYIIYGPLITGIPTVVFEGTLMNPHPGIWWDIVAKHKVSVMFSAATALRVLRTYDEQIIRKADLSSLKHFFIAGEICDAPTQKWGSKVLGLPVIDHYWQTESGWPMTGLCMGLENMKTVSGAAGVPCVGWNFKIVDEQKQEVKAGTRGHLVGNKPLPPGSFTDVWNASDRYKTYYFGKHDGDYTTFDWAQQDENGYVTLLGRSDRVVNVAGHRIAIIEVEHVLSEQEEVQKVSAIGIPDKLKTEGISCYVVPKAGVIADAKLRIKLNRAVRETLGAVAVPKEIHFVDEIPD